MQVQIENVQKCKGQGWYAIFDLVITFEERRKIRIGRCGVEFVEDKAFLRLPTKLRRDTGKPYQLNFFDNETWRDLIKEVAAYFGEAAI